MQLGFTDSQVSGGRLSKPITLALEELYIGKTERDAFMDSLLSLTDLDVVRHFVSDP